MKLATAEGIALDLAVPLRRYFPKARELFWRYGTAVVSTGLALYVRSLLQPWLKEECPFSLFYLSVLLTACIAGTGPAILAIVLGTISAAQFFIEPASSLHIDSLPDLVQLGIYVFVNLVATSLFARLNRQRSLAEFRSDENEKLSRSLREADEKKDEFLALLAHELRNPLAPIRSALALLARGPSPDDIDRVCGIVSRQTEYMIRITNDLLEVSRFQRGTVELQIEPFDLREAIYDAIEMTADAVQAKNHTLRPLVPNECVMVDGDRMRLAQSLANLIGNAAKYTPAGGRITLHTDVVGDVVTTSVIDNGIGFPPSEAERILQPFTQIDMSRTREYGGLGVGLSIVDRFVSLHQGKLTAESRGPGLGSRFTLVLPLSAAKDQPPVRGATDSDLPCEQRGTIRETMAHNGQRSIGSPHKSDKIREAQSGERVHRELLIVEDNPDASQLLAELFEGEGFEVRQANDGVDALQHLSTRIPDVVVLDIGLPGMDGYEVARRIRRLHGGQQVLLIALTGWGTEADRRQARESGFDEHMVKPVNFLELVKLASGNRVSAPATILTTADA